MASQAYYDWLDAGKPYTTARPAAKVAANIRRHGYTVYEIGNTSHMQAVPPEDHTPFSATGWPKTSPRWYGHAIDIMPPPSGKGLPTLAQLAQQIHDDKQAGVAGAATVKYMNWEPDGPGGKCVHCSWQSSHASTSSTDYGHIHVSFRSDKTTSSEADSYDPVQRWKDGQNDMGTLEGVTTEGLQDFVRTDNAVPNLPWRSDYRPLGDNAPPTGPQGGTNQYIKWETWFVETGNEMMRQREALARIEAMLTSGVEVSPIVKVDPTSQQEIAEAVADELHERSES